MEQMLICLSLSLIAARCSDDIQKYLGITLLPQAGVALGMAATAAQLSDGHTSARVENKPEMCIRDRIRNVCTPTWCTICP